MYFIGGKSRTTTKKNNRQKARIVNRWIFMFLSNCVFDEKPLPILSDYSMIINWRDTFHLKMACLHCLSSQRTATKVSLLERTKKNPNYFKEAWAFDLANRFAKIKINLRSLTPPPLCHTTVLSVTRLMIWQAGLAPPTLPTLTLFRD